MKSIVMFVRGRVVSSLDRSYLRMLSAMGLIMYSKCVALFNLTSGGPCQHGLICGCNFVSSGALIGPYRPK